MKKVVVIGSLNMDFSVSVPVLPKPGETIKAKSIDFICGGKGANQAYTLGSLGSDITMLGAVGNDEYGKKLITNLRKVNVNTDYIRTVEDSTGIAIVSVDEASENSITIISGANNYVTKEYIDENINILKEADFLVLQLEIPIDTVKYVLKFAQENNKKVILDPAPAIKDFDFELLNGIYVMKPNETELEILTNNKIKNQEDIKGSSLKLLEHGVQNVVVSLGKEGSMLVNKSGITMFNSLDVKAVDTTAAGDSFTGALVNAISNNASIEQAISYATIVSAIVVTKKGAQSSIPTSREVNEFIKNMTLEKEKIIIDTDPGVDDLFAILMAGKEPKLDILGITTVEGNCSLENATQNAIKALDLADRNDVLVYKGEKSNVNINANDVHGNNGFGGVEYELVNRQAEKMNAVDYLIKTAQENKGKLTIVAIGPLTNIAEAIKRDPEFSRNIKQLLIMGGSTTHGNISPHAEFNFYKDPVSANEVLNSNIKNIILFGLNVTEQLPLTKNREEQLLNSNQLGKFLYDVTRIAAKRDAEFGGAIINDPITIAYLINKDIVKLKKANVSVLTEGSKIGKSIVEFNDNGKCLVATKINSDLFYKLLFSNILK